MDLTSINNEDYIGLNDAENYLSGTPDIVTLISDFYLKYCGLAGVVNLLVDEPIERQLSPEGYLLERELEPNQIEAYFFKEKKSAKYLMEKVYVEGVIQLEKAVLIRNHLSGLDSRISKTNEFTGSICGVNGFTIINSGAWGVCIPEMSANLRTGCFYAENSVISIIEQKLNIIKTSSNDLSLSDGDKYNDNILVKLSGLDTLAKKYGIPKKLEEEKNNINSEVTLTAASKSLTRKLLTIKEPNKQNERYKAIKKCIDIFESKNGFTPSFDELYPHLVSTKHSNDEIFTWESSCKQNAKDRYKRYYPASSGNE